MPLELLERQFRIGCGSAEGSQKRERCCHQHANDPESDCVRTSSPRMLEGMPTSTLWICEAVLAMSDPFETLTQCCINLDLKPDPRAASGNGISCTEPTPLCDLDVQAMSGMHDLTNEVAPHPAESNHTCYYVKCPFVFDCVSRVITLIWS